MSKAWGSKGWDFPGGPGIKTLCSECRGSGFNLWAGNYIPHAATKAWFSQINTFFFFFLKHEGSKQLTVLTVRHWEECPLTVGDSPLSGESSLEAAFDWKDCIQIGYMDFVSPKSIFYSQTFVYFWAWNFTWYFFEEVSLYFYFLKIKNEAEEIL